MLKYTGCYHWFTDQKLHETDSLSFTRTQELMLYGVHIIRSKASQLFVSPAPATGVIKRPSYWPVSLSSEAIIQGLTLTFAYGSHLKNY